MSTVNIPRAAISRGRRKCRDISSRPGRPQTSSTFATNRQLAGAARELPREAASAETAPTFIPVMLSRRLNIPAMVMLV